MFEFKKKHRAQPPGQERQNVNQAQPQEQVGQDLNHGQPINGGADQMNESTAKRIEKIAMYDGSIFPTAKELHTDTSVMWKYITAEEVLEKLIEESRKGNCEALFYRVIITQTVRDMLESRGYVVKDLSDKVPTYKVEW